MHVQNKEAIDILDSAIFNGDTFYDEDNLKLLEETIARWNKEIEHIKTAIEENKTNL